MLLFVNVLNINYHLNLEKINFFLFALNLFSFIKFKIQVGLSNILNTFFKNMDDHFYNLIYIYFFQYLKKCVNIQVHVCYQMLSQ